MPDPGVKNTAASQRGKWWLRLVLALLCFLVLSVAGCFWLLSSIVERRIVAALQDAGAGPVSLRVTRLGPSHAELSGVSIGDGQRVSAGKIAVDFDIAGLRRGTVRTVVIDDATVELRVHDGGIDLGPLIRLASGGTHVPQASTPQVAHPMPFDSVTLRHAALVLEVSGVRLHVPIDATITNRGSGELAVDALLEVMDHTVVVRGSVFAPTTSGEPWRVAMDCSGSLQPPGITEPVQIQISTTGTFSSGPQSKTDLLVKLKRTQLAGKNWSLGEVDAEWPIVVGSGAPMPRGKFSIGQVNIAGRKLAAITGTLGVAESRAELRADWPLVQGTPIVASAWLDASLAGGVIATLAPVELAAAREWTALVPALENAALTGLLSAEATVKMVDGSITPAAWLRIKNGGYDDAASGVRATGVSGEVSLNPFAPQSSAKVTSLTIDRLDLGDGVRVGAISLGSAGMTSTGASLSNITSGRGLKIGGVEFEVKEGRLGGVVISDAVAEVRVRSGVVDLSWLGVLPADSSRVDVSARAAPPAPAKSQPSPLMGSLEVRRGSVIVDWEGVRVECPIELKISKASGRIDVEATVRMLDLPWHIRGSFTPEDEKQDRAWRVDMAMDAIDWPAARDAEVRVKADGLRVTGRVRGANAASELRMELIGGAFKAPAVDVTDVTAALPIAWGPGATPAAPGEFRLGAIALNGKKYPPFTGTASLSGGKARFSADWAVVKEAPVHASGWIDTSLRGEATAKIAPFELADTKSLAELLPAIKGLDLSGKVSIDASISRTDGPLKQRVTLGVREGRFVDQESDLTVEGVEGDISIAAFFPLLTAGSQTLSIAKLAVGKTSLVQGTLAFAVDRPDSLLIEKTQWGWDDGGTLRVFDARIESGKPVAMEVFFENMGVARWLELLTGDSVTGDGRLYGRVPITYHPTGVGKDAKNARPFSIGRGFLYGNPGPGWFKVRDQQVIGSLIAGGAVEGVPEEVRARLQEGLANFEYSELKFDFIPPAEGKGDVLCVLSTKGKSRNPERPVNFQGITVNLSGIEDALHEASRPLFEGIEKTKARFAR